MISDECNTPVHNTICENVSTSLTPLDMFSAVTSQEPLDDLPILRISVLNLIFPDRNLAVKVSMYAHMSSPVKRPPVSAAFEGGGMGQGENLNSPCTLHSRMLAYQEIMKTQTCLLIVRPG